MHVPNFSGNSGTYGTNGSSSSDISGSSSGSISSSSGSDNSGRVSISTEDYASLNKRLERLEKQAMIPTPKQKSATDSFVDSLKMDLLELSPKTIEICSTCGFFVFGCILGASLLDRLWLVGGESWCRTSPTY